MRQSTSKLFLACSFIFLLFQQLYANINPQAGESLWTIASKIAQYFDETQDFTIDINPQAGESAWAIIQKIGQCLDGTQDIVLTGTEIDLTDGEIGGDNTGDNTGV